MTFAYHRSVAPMLWVLVALSVVELCAVHLLVALLWSVTAALILSAVTVAGIVWLVLLIRSFRRLPVLLGDDGITWRAGMLRGLTVPVSDIAGPRASWDAAAVKRRNVFNAALIAYPNVVLDLAAPVTMGRRQITALAHRLDNPEAFLAALAARRG